MMIWTKIKIALAFAAVLTLALGWVEITALKADKARLASAVELSRVEAAGLRDTLARERAAYKAAALAITTASRAQNAASRADMERRALIDDISRESKAIERPKGSIDEQTSGKVVEMLNSSLFSPLGGGVRTEAN